MMLCLKKKNLMSCALYQTTHVTVKVILRTFIILQLSLDRQDMHGMTDAEK